MHTGDHIHHECWIKPTKSKLQQVNKLNKKWKKKNQILLLLDFEIKIRPVWEIERRKERNAQQTASNNSHLKIRNKHILFIINHQIKHANML